MSFTFGKKRGQKTKELAKAGKDKDKDKAKLDAEPATKRYVVTIPLFGSPLEDLSEAYGTAIPTLIRETISLISKPGTIDCQGLFVLDGESPHWERAQELRDRYEKEISVALQPEDVHAAAALLKIFLHELPLPVLTYELYELFMEASASRGEDQEVELLLDLQRIISMLPYISKFVLSYLMTFFFRVSSHSEKNGLTTANIGRIFGPLLLPPQETEREKRLAAQRHITRITQLLIEQYQVICFSLNSSSIPTKKDSKSPPPPTPSKVQLPTQVSDDLVVVTVRAFKEYVANNFTELSLRPGDYVRVLSQNPGAMWEGELDEKTGLFPAEYCEVIAVVKKLQYKVDLTRVNPKIRAFQNRLFEKKEEEEEEKKEEHTQKNVTTVVAENVRPLGATTQRFQKPLSSRATRTMAARGAQPRRIISQQQQQQQQQQSNTNTQTVTIESKLFGEDHPLELERKKLKEQSEELEKETQKLMKELADLKKELHEQKEHKKILDIQISSIEGELETVKDQLEKQEKNFVKAKQVRQQMEENLVSVTESFSKRKAYMDEVQAKMAEMGNANVFRGSQGFTGSASGSGDTPESRAIYKNPSLANRPKSSSYAVGVKDSLSNPSPLAGSTGSPAVRNLRSQWESKG